MRQILEEFVKQGRELEVFRVCMKVDVGTSLPRGKMAVVLTHEEETVVAFHSFREVAFRNQGGLISMGVQALGKPVLVLVFPDKTEEINVRNSDNLRGQSLKNTNGLKHALIR